MIPKTLGPFHKARARAYLMTLIDATGEDFGPDSPIGLAIDAGKIDDPMVMSWELYGAVLDILREEARRDRNRREHERHCTSDNRLVATDGKLG